MVDSGEQDDNASQVSAGLSVIDTKTVAEVWCVNPLIVNFNPGTKAGQTIFEKKTKGLPLGGRFTATKKDSQAIRRYLHGKSETLGKVLTRIPISYDSAGTANGFGDLLTEYASIPLECLQREAHKFFQHWCY